MKKIKPIKLSQEVFKPYGWVIMQGETEPDIANEQIEYWDDMADITSMGNMGSLGFMRVKRIPVKLGMLQLLHNSSELYITLDGNPSVVFVALSGHDENPDLSTLKAFLLENGQSIVVNKKVWHCTPFALTEKTDFALGLKNNVIIKNADGSFGVDLDTIVYSELKEEYTIDNHFKKEK